MPIDQRRFTASVATTITSRPMPAMKPACRFAQTRNSGGSNQSRRPPERRYDSAIQSVQQTSAKVKTCGRVPSTGSAVRAPSANPSARTTGPTPRSRPRSSVAPIALHATSPINTVTRSSPPTAARAAKMVSDSHSCATRGLPNAVYANSSPAGIWWWAMIQSPSRMCHQTSGSLTASRPTPAVRMSTAASSAWRESESQATT